MIPIYKPYLPKKTIKFAHQALDSSWISNLGEFKDCSKNLLNNILDCKSNILTNNGTTSTHLIYKALKFKNPNIKNLIVPCNVYVAAWNAMLFDGDNINLIPVRTNLKTWNMDLEDIILECNKRSAKDTAILVVHNLGGIINTKEIKRRLPEYLVIEDNCEGFLGKYENSFAGTECLASSISFYGNKTITCGEGGALILNDLELLEKLEKTHSQGQTKTRYIHDVLGYNYRMTNIQAAILYGQLLIKDEILKKKKIIFNRYKKNLKNNRKIIFQFEEENCENALWMFSIRILNNKNFQNSNDFFLKNGIETRNMFYPMSYHEHLKKYSNKDKELEAEILLKEIVILPSSPSLKKDEIDYISEKILKYCENEV
jgi:perosamine synthetase